jgi:hypothetical protein
MYRQFFFCPKVNSPLTSDSVARLDRLQVSFTSRAPGSNRRDMNPRSML